MVFSRSILFLSSFFLFIGCKDTVTPAPFELVQPVVFENPGCIDAYAINFDPDKVISDTVCVYNHVSCADCDYVLEPDKFKLDNEELNLAPGSVIGIRGGNRTVILIENFFGEANNPFIFTNCDGRANLNLDDKPEAIRIENSSYLRVTGTGSADFYGINIDKGTHGVRAHRKTNNVEIDHIEVANVGIGVWAVTRPSCDGSSNRESYVQENISVHDNFIHDVHGEGTYIGGSKWESGFKDNNCVGETLYQPDLIGIRVFNNILEDIGWDGVQVGGAVEDCQIYNNRITNYGIGADAAPLHQAGMMINPGTTGKIFANLINGGTGVGIFILGFDNLVYSNLIVNPGLHGIAVGDRQPLANKSYRILNNTIYNTGENGINFNTDESVNNIIQNNLIVDVSEEYLNTRTDNVTSVSNIFSNDFSDLEFENASIYDFTPIEDGILLDSGSSYTNEELIFDFLLRRRIVNDTLDIGAFERQSADD